MTVVANNHDVFGGNVGGMGNAFASQMTAIVKLVRIRGR